MLKANEVKQLDQFKTLEIRKNEQRNLKGGDDNVGSQDVLDI